MPKVLFFALLLACTSSFAATLYISDELTVPLRRGPTNGHRIVNAALPSGMALEVLGEDKAAGFTQVRTPNGTDGWVPTQYLTTQPAARDLLVAANKRVEALEAQLKSTRDDAKETRSAQSQAQSRNSELDKQTKQLQSELAELRRVSATSITQYEENKTLKVENQRLNAQVSELGSKVSQLQRGTQFKFLLGGGALVLLGLAFGAWIKSRPKRSTWA
ncbi:TIGR04211 family SH3 domain-containing protein [Povalibacter sp.]|uniref:TIGR04211 family SH3 domain-containing protein n=1 Tax=Povalibacter sp. TaxID=1962978 RepID=UPI002F417B8C